MPHSDPETTPTEDLYDILEVNFRASYEDIQRAYRRLAKIHHRASDSFRQITSAYERLIDKEKREIYDAKRAGQRDGESARSGDTTITSSSIRQLEAEEEKQAPWLVKRREWDAWLEQQVQRLGTEAAKIRSMEAEVAKLSAKAEEEERQRRAYGKLPQPPTSSGDCNGGVGCSLGLQALKEVRLKEARDRLQAFRFELADQQTMEYKRRRAEEDQWYEDWLDEQAEKEERNAGRRVEAERQRRAEAEQRRAKKEAVRRLPGVSGLIEGAKAKHDQ